MDIASVAGQLPAKALSRTRKNLFCALTAATALLAILVLGETGARLFYRGNPLPEPPPLQAVNPSRPNPFVASMRPYLFFHIPDARYVQKIFSHRNEYQINSMGFRGPEITPQPAPGKKRLLVLGDSVVEGHGVRFAETFSQHLGNKLAEHNWEVINVGMQGASPLYFAANLERYLYLQPDAVLVMVHENDLYDDELREKAYFSSPLLADRAGLYSGGRSHSPGAKSRLYGLLENGWKIVSRSPLEKIIADNAAKPGIHADAEASRRRLSSFAVPPDKFAARLKMSSTYLAYALEEFRSRNIQVLLSSLCTVTLSFPANQSYADHCVRLEDHARDWAQENEVPFLSLVPAMQQAFAAHKITDVLILNDFHPTPMTHGLLADALYPFVLQNLPGNGSSPANNPLIERK